MHEPLDMLVRLYDLPDVNPFLDELKKEGIVVRKPIGPEQPYLSKWIEETFGPVWAGEVMSAFYRSPKGVYIAVEEKDGEKPKLLGFAAYDATCKGMFGPTGVAPEARMKGIGRAVMLSCLHAMKEEGYGYAVIGDTEKWEYYNKCCGATPIEGSSPGVFEGFLRV